MNDKIPDAMAMMPPTAVADSEDLSARPGSWSKAKAWDGSPPSDPRYADTVRCEYCGGCEDEGAGVVYVTRVKSGGYSVHAHSLHHDCAEKFRWSHRSDKGEASEV